MANEEILPERGSKKFWKRGLKKLGKDVKQTASVLEHLTPGGLTKKILNKAIPKFRGIDKAMSLSSYLGKGKELKGGGRAVLKKGGKV